MSWLTAPYYTPGPILKVETGAPYGSQQTISSALDQVVKGMLDDPAGFVNGGVGVGGPDQIVKDYIAFAQILAEQPFRSITDPLVDPVALGTYYAGIVVRTLKQIKYGADGEVSFYDVWTGARPA